MMKKSTQLKSSRKPGAPAGVLIIKQVTETSLQLEWNPPKDDGGLDILGYVIKMEVQGDPKPTEFILDEPRTRHVVPKLRLHKRYQFGVAAKTAAGLGEFLQSSQPTMLFYDTEGREQPTFGVGNTSANESAHLAVLRAVDKFLPPEEVDILRMHIAMMKEDTELKFSKGLPAMELFDKLSDVGFIGIGSYRQLYKALVDCDLLISADALVEKANYFFTHM